MKIVCVNHSYNNEEMIYECLSGTAPLVDYIITTEGCVDVYNKFPQRSTDKTLEKINEACSKYKNIIYIEHPGKGFCKTRERAEGYVKTHLLNKAAQQGILENEDWIFTVDSDEFYHSNELRTLINLLKTKYAKYDCGRIYEWQFAYNLNLCFPSSHGRFMKYKIGSEVHSTHKLVWPNGKNVWSGKKFTVERSECEMYHLSYSQHPVKIRRKVLSFNRPSFTSWYNKTYLEWPDNNEQAYLNNSKIGPWFGNGFCEGNNERLVPFSGNLPKSIPYQPDYLDYIRQNKGWLKI